MARPSKLEGFVERFGKEPDSKIAADAGVTTEAVRAARVKRGIGSWAANGGAASAPADESAPAKVAKKTKAKARAVAKLIDFGNRYAATPEDVEKAAADKRALFLVNVDDGGSYIASTSVFAVVAQSLADVVKRYPTASRIESVKVTDVVTL